MKIIAKNQAKKVKNGKNCTAIEYDLKDKNISGAKVEISGRYPERGRVVNLKCQEIAYVMQGFGKITVGDQKMEIQEGDYILIERGEKFFWEGNLVLFLACAPAWSPEQYQEIE